MNDELLSSIATMFFLLAASAFFSASETAFSAVNRNRLKSYADKGNKRAALAKKLADEYDQLLSAILIGNNLVNITLASFGTVFFVRYLGAAGSSVAVVVVTIVVLVLGEITPKCLAKDCAEQFAVFAAPILQLCIWISLPFNRLFMLWKNALTRFFRLDHKGKSSPEELLLMVDEVQQDGGINKNEGELLRNAIEFSEVEARDIATPRVRLGAVSINATTEEIIRTFDETKFSRLLVYRDNIDDIIGVIHSKNFFNYKGISNKSLSEIMSPAVFVPTTEKIYSVLKKLQNRQAQVAVVVDEFGGTFGIVTTEDVLEELVGEIWDEMDNVSEPFRRVNDSVVRVDASVNLDDFREYFDIAIESDMITLNGWIADELNTLPHRGDHFKYKNLEITVVKTERRCVSIIEVKVLPQE